MSDNLLKNPYFEDGFRKVNNVGELMVAAEWYPWWIEEGPRHRPEYKPEERGIGAGRVHEAQYAQKLFTTFAPHDGGFLQKVLNVYPGERYRFTAWVYCWSSSADNPDEATRPWGKMSALLGINPWGRTDPQHRTTVWGQEILDQYNGWYLLSVEAEAWSETITVATRSIAEFGAKHNDSYWDQFALAQIIEKELPGPVGGLTRQDLARALRAAAESLERL